MDEIDHILALSAKHEEATSALTRPLLEAMLQTAFHSATIGAGRDAYLISFDQDAAYQSENFLWFKARYPRFVYVDRIVVADHAQGKGLGHQLYRDLFEKARHSGHSRILCEINLEPANPGSLLFHARQGFSEVGSARLSNNKRVSYQCRLI